MAGMDWSIQPGQVVQPQCVFYFGASGCHSCEEADQYITEVEAAYPTLSVQRFEVHNVTNWDLMVSLYMAHNMTTYSTPVAFIGDKVLIGPSSIKDQLVGLLLNNTGRECPSVNATIPSNSSATSPPVEIILAMAFADSLNPCAIAVLLLLIVALSAAGEKVFATGAAYIAGNFVAYLLIGYGIFAILSQFQLPFYTTKIIGALAVVVALVSLFSKIPVSQKPTVKKLIEGATAPPVAFFAGAIISAIELPCTGGPYFLATALMRQYNLGQFEVLGFLMLYNLIFVLPLVLILLLNIFAKTPKIPRDYVRYASAIAMWAIGIFLVLM